MNIVKSYFKNLIYGVFELVSAFINFMFYLLGLSAYANRNFGVDYLVWLETARIESELMDHINNKNRELDKADWKVEKAKELLNEQDKPK